MLFLGKNGRINSQAKQAGANYFTGTAVCNEAKDCMVKYELSIPKELKDDSNGFVIISVIREGDHSHLEKKTQIRGKKYDY